MARSKKIPSKEILYKPEVRQREDPDKYLNYNPSWIFNQSDKDGAWGINKENLVDKMWSDIIPRLKNFETMTWSDILISAKVQNHSIPINQLNKVAKDRLKKLNILDDEIVSLRVDAKTRIYGFIYGAKFKILWCDFNHGNNNECVCKSTLKHT